MKTWFSLLDDAIRDFPSLQNWRHRVPAISTCFAVFAAQGAWRGTGVPIFFIMLIVLGILAACGSKDSDVSRPEPEPPPVSRDDALAETQGLFAQSFCKSAWQCQSQDLPFNFTFLSGRFLSEEACISTLSRASSGFATPTSSLERGLREGRIVYNGVEASKCINGVQESIAKDPCAGVTRLLSEVPACQMTYEGQVAQGNPCLIDEDCAAGLVCRVGADPNQCFGRCESPSALQAQEGESCQNDRDCGVSDILTCNRVSEDEAGICVRNFSLAEGEACKLDSLVCETGTLCEGLSTEMPTCKAFTLSAQGESCDLLLTFCSIGLTCQQGQCQPVAQRDEPCVNDFHCAYDLYCDDASQSCQARKAEGEPCERFTECEATLDCRNAGNRGRCGPPESTTCQVP